MKILQVVHGFPPRQRGGTEIYTYYLSKELSRKHEIHASYPTYENTNKLFLRSYKREGLYLHEIVTPRGFISKINLIWSSLFFERTYININVEKIFREILKKVNPDVIHFEHLIGLSITLINVAKEFNITTVLTLHDYWVLCPNITLLTWDDRICEGPEADKCRECWAKIQERKFSEALNLCFVPAILTKIPLEFILRKFNPPKKFKIRNELMKYLLLKVDKIIAPSRFLRNTFINYGISEDKIIYSENGYDLKVFKKFKKKKKKSKIVFGFAGGISKQKGVHILVDAFMSVPEDKAELWIYGSYNLSSEYIRILQKVNEKKNISFLGKCENVKELYSKIDVLIFPSICYENCPLVLAEARATKVPVIASNIGAIPEFFDNSESLFNPNDTNDLFLKIMELIEHPALMRKFNIKPPKSIEEQAKKIERIFLESIENERK